MIHTPLAWRNGGVLRAISDMAMASGQGLPFTIDRESWIDRGLRCQLLQVSSSYGAQVRQYQRVFRYHLASNLLLLPPTNASTALPPSKVAGTLVAHVSVAFEPWSRNEPVTSRCAMARGETSHVDHTLKKMLRIFYIIILVDCVSAANGQHLAQRRDFQV
jgi:hypothetical protein